MKFTVFNIVETLIGDINTNENMLYKSKANLEELKTLTYSLIEVLVELSENYGSIYHSEQEIGRIAYRSLLEIKEMIGDQGVEAAHKAYTKAIMEYREGDK